MAHDEIERKFLVERPQEWPVPNRKLTIEQRYLLNDKEGVDERVRQTLGDGKNLFTHTLKEHVGRGHALEDEREITVQEFDELSLRIDPETRPIIKVRTVFEWDGFTWELDLFKKPFGIYLLEVELPSLDTPITFPPFIPLIREVTGEREWSNASLARQEEP